MNVMDKIFDENNSENIVMYNEMGEAVEFEQIAVIPLDGKVYVILRPAELMEGMADDEALVLSVEDNGDEEFLSLVDEDSIIDRVFEEYYDMLREAGVEV